MSPIQEGPPCATQITRICNPQLSTLDRLGECSLEESVVTLARVTHYGTVVSMQEIVQTVNPA
jgi:hypothetical protein